MSPTHVLRGCRPEPLGSYLKALGVFRLVSEQLDSTATGRWASHGFELRCNASREQIEQFFLTSYRPTPIVSPWNSSSGFGREGEKELHVIEISDDPRLLPYREAVAVARTLLARMAAGDWDKETMVLACRAHLPDACVEWIDASIILTGVRAVYPPLLGTGGNDGRLEFSRNFHQRVIDVLGLSPSRTADPTGWLLDALDGSSASALLRGKSPGQFDASATGGPNSAVSGAADSLLNPWDWVLLIEGALLFASGAARRMATEVGGRAAAPFTVESSATGYPSAVDGEPGRGEVWLPLWGREAGLGEFKRLVAEGKADWRGHHARTGLELVGAIASLGADRGVDVFSRQALLERNGKNMLSVPVGRVVVAERPLMAPIARIDEWLEQVRRFRAALPGRAASQLRRVDEVMFALAAGHEHAGSGTGTLLGLLVATAELEASIATSRVAANVRPLARSTRLEATTWVPLLLEEAGGLESTDALELRLAVALASGRDLPGGGARQSDGSSTAAELFRNSWELDGRRLSPLVDGLDRRSIIDVLSDALVARAVRASTATRQGADAVRRETSTRFSRSITARLGDVAALALGFLDEELLRDALRACLILDFRSAPDGMLSLADQVGPGFVPPWLNIIGPFFAEQPLPSASPEVTDLGRPGVDPSDSRLPRTALEADMAWPAMLRAGRVSDVGIEALRRLRIARIAPVAGPRPDAVARGHDANAGRRLAAALLVPVGSADRLRMLRTVSPNLDSASSNHPAKENSNAEP